ncbi:MAG: 3'-5' exonuclease domain-containing protein 2 [Dysgonamonadaceae bacterium]|nr:3'-5' exonuclease domain-containing protein 2 [Dysgonamonadaceae bacterium]
MGKTITKEEISKYPAETFDGQIVEIKTVNGCEEAVNYLSGYDLLGFDTETRPTFKKGNVNGVALIQLSTNDTCFLFRLNIIGFPPSLIRLLSNPDVLKIGLSLRDDFHSMGRRLKFTPQGFFDLQTVVKNYDIDDLSLQKIYALLFQKKISKSQRLTNWEADLLSESQKRYAALDAWACLKIYKELCLTKKSI